jgi:hypothetical protein
MLDGSFCQKQDIRQVRNANATVAVVTAKWKRLCCVYAVIIIMMGLVTSVLAFIRAVYLTKSSTRRLEHH